MATIQPMDPTHYYEMFSANVKTLLGEHPARSILADICNSEAGGGEGKWLDSMNPLSSDDATTTKTTDVKTRNGYGDLAAIDETFANWKATMTPHMGVVKQRTWSEPYKNEWGHYFSEDQEWLELSDPKGRTINIGMQKMFKEVDEVFADRITAATVQRKYTGQETITAVDLPASQTMEDLTYADLDINNLTPVIMEKFENVYATKGMPVYCVISARMKREIVTQNREVIHNHDFVSSYAQFAKGDLPEIDGVTFICMPNSFMGRLASGDAIDSYFAFSPMAVTRVDYTGMKVTAGRSIDHRDDYTAYLRRDIDFRRVDDLGVVLGDIVSA